MKTVVPEPVPLAAAAGHQSASYAGQNAVLTTMHGKEEAIAPVLRARLGLIVSAASDIDTDALGTFTGEIPRTGTIRDVAIAKARLGMEAVGLPIGLGSEGSYGPHPEIPLVPGGVELMVLVDDTRGIVVSEHLIDDTPAFGHAYAEAGDDLTPVLDRLGFPKHALIVKPAESDNGAGHIFKGLRERATLKRAVMSAQALSKDGRALIQTDMRAHMNPTRMAQLGRLASALAERLSQLCPACGMPGYGQIDVETGLPCDWCGSPSQMVRQYIFSCVSCLHRENRPRDDGLTHADPKHCPSCNP
ncbi:DUF6671 family protein [Rhizobium sp. EC-SD404]|uniref:DUF6671 family protein n=1 Tax=Rhizobium sp. EC-SD404 TaxID=2038389 RepID=UPI00125C6A2B|nr:DUF6671 family protein [Rhizobium sp. EC-SD404]VVT31953.1 conserved hypothetical protein [Rhizobium sp. EC-SD404]